MVRQQKLSAETLHRPARQISKATASSPDFRCPRSWVRYEPEWLVEVPQYVPCQPESSPDFRLMKTARLLASLCLAVQAHFDTA
jgi:hypothetical protein